MALKASTGLRDAVLATGSIKATLDGGFIQIYSGPAPLTADDAIGSQGANTLLCTISVDGLGGGINFDAAAASGALSKAPGETWKGTNAVGGTAAFYRHVATGDDGTLSTTQARLQGDIAVTGAELNLSSITLTGGAEQNIDSYSVALPTF
jgi:hypothetical protein